MADFDYDLIAIGAGTAGLTVTRLVAGSGKRVAMVEADRPGGDCLWTGCVPTKALLQSAKAFWDAKHAGRFGVVAGDVRLDFAAVRRHLLASQEAAGRVETEEAIAANGVELLRGRARFIDDHTLDIDGKKVTGARIAIATGSEPTIPPIPGLAEAGPETNVEALSWEELPKSLCIIGGGAIGLEFAQMMNRFGVVTTLVEGLPRIMAAGEPAASAVIADTLRGEGVTLYEGSSVTRVERTGSRKRVHFDLNGEEHVVECERILVATGRRPRVEGLGLDAAEVEYSVKGIPVDKKLRTSKKHIYALGDVNGGPQFTHVADDQARQAAAGINGSQMAAWDDRVVPRVIFTDPEVATVGLTEQEARTRHGKRVKVFEVALEDVDRAITMGVKDGFFKVITARGGWNRFIPGAKKLMGDPIVGATLVAPGAGELLAPISMAMKAYLPIGLAAWPEAPYPTLALGLRQALGRQFDR